MALFALTSSVVSVNAVDYSDHLKSASLVLDATQLDTTDFASAGWVEMMKASMRSVMNEFTSHRMVSQYDSMFYRQGLLEHAALLDDDAKRVRGLVHQRSRLLSHWKNVKIAAPRSQNDMSALHVGDRYRLSSEVQLGGLKPEEVDVEAYYGVVDAQNRPVESHRVKMTVAEDRGNGNFLYECEIDCDQTGRYGFTARVKPQGLDWHNVMPGFITWAGH